MDIFTKIATLTALLISTHTPTNAELAWRIAGEARGCPMIGRVAVVNVSRNRDQAGIKGGWSHSQILPSAQDWTLAGLVETVPDVTDGALWLFGPGDADHPVVQKIQADARMTLHVPCADGDFVEAWAP